MLTFAEYFLLENKYDPDTDSEYLKKDNIKEFNFYKKIGIGEDISSKEYASLIDEATLKKFTPDQLLEIRPELKEIAKGKTIKEKLKSLRSWYAKEKREPYGKVSGKLTLGNTKYLDSLIDAMEKDEVEAPPILLKLNNHYLVSGGRTRIAIAYCLNKPIKCKVVKIHITDKDKAKKSLKKYFDISIESKLEKKEQKR